jgi:hypothetical protein
MSDRIERWASIAVGVGVFALVGWVTYAESEKHAKPRAAREDAGASAASTSHVEDAAAPIASIAPTAVFPETDGGLGFFLDASIAMPTGAPRTVHIGVVLVQYVGAEGASNNARTKAEARTLAERLRDDAKADFKKAVRDGDSGSSEDIGRIPRGVLDPRTEIAVFSMTGGEISEILETPKGFWIVKRLD